MENFTIKKYLEIHSKLSKNLNLASIENCINLIEKKFLEGKKIFTCGNGGSATTASHFITDWNKMINISRSMQFKGICLSDNIGLITAYANDISFDHVFSGQLESLYDDGDLLVCISCSGNSKNVINAANYVISKGGPVIALVGFDGGELIKLTDNSFHVPSFDMQLCEDIHLKFGHMAMKRLCKYNIVDD